MISDRVAVHLLEMIHGGELVHGEKLPPERELATALGVGRPAVREALSALHMMQVIEVRPGSGAYVRSSSDSILVRPVEVFAALVGLDLQALFEAREILEVGISGLAAERISDEEIAELRACLSQLREATDNSEEFLRLDEELHSAIVRVCANPLLSSLMASVDALGHLSRQVASLFSTSNSQVLEDHERIVTAIASGDVEQSKAAMTTHLRNVRRIMESIQTSDLADLTQLSLAEVRGASALMGRLAASRGRPPSHWG
jgi:DNA-binding FadR family transcriptional regulator